MAILSSVWGRHGVTTAFGVCFGSSFRSNRLDHISIVPRSSDVSYPSRRLAAVVVKTLTFLEETHGFGPFCWIFSRRHPYYLCICRPHYTCLCRSKWSRE